MIWWWIWFDLVVMNVCTFSLWSRKSTDCKRGDIRYNIIKIQLAIILTTNKGYEDLFNGKQKILININYRFTTGCKSTSHMESEQSVEDFRNGRLQIPMVRIKAYLNNV
uniref:Uncharacterized protein n=1 Tax=Glossina austeni TaxID=7395 RepID=A0A1A9V0J5_GLOAU